VRPSAFDRNDPLSTRPFPSTRGVGVGVALADASATGDAVEEIAAGAPAPAGGGAQAEISRTSATGVTPLTYSA